MFAPDPFLGDYSRLGPAAHFEMDLRTEASTGHLPEMILQGPGGTAYFPDSSPGVVTRGWQHFSIPITQNAWQMRSGTWAALLTNVTSVLLSLDIVGGGPLDGNVDNFALIGDRTDVAPTSLSWNTPQGGVDFGYEVAGGDLTQDTTAALYWASGPTFADRIGGPIYDTQVEHPQGTYGPVHVPKGVLGAPPAGATHLLLVVDPTSTAQPNGAIDESDETNNVASLPIPNIRVTGVTTDDSRSVRLSYTVEGTDADPIPIKVFRSSDETYSSDDVEVALTDTTAPGSIGDHSGANAVTLRLNDPFAIDPSRPFVIVVADPDDTILETTEVDNHAHFRKRVLGVVTHGYQPLGFSRYGFPAWITEMASTLRNGQHYDRAVAFDWARQSSLPLRGQAVAAGARLAERIRLEILRMTSAFPGDVIDVHLIGHSRGAVVIDQALNNLTGNVEVTRGTAKMTMLDPHPARNYPFVQYYSVIPPGFGFVSQLGAVAEAGLLAFQAAANDPLLFRPANADVVENFYQRTPALLTQSLAETVLNLWGEGPFDWASNYNLTSPGMSHTKVVDWYMNNVLHTLGGGFNPPAGGNGMSTVTPFLAPNRTDNGNSALPAGGISGDKGGDTSRIKSSNRGIRPDVSGGNGKNRIELDGVWDWVQVHADNGTDTAKDRGTGLLELWGIERSDRCPVSGPV
jgi:hypothetical protein